MSNLAICLCVCIICFTLFICVYTIMDALDDKDRRYWDWVERNEDKDTDDL